MEENYGGGIRGNASQLGPGCQTSCRSRDVSSLPVVSVHTEWIKQVSKIIIKILMLEPCLHKNAFSLFM